MTAIIILAYYNVELITNIESFIRRASGKENGYRETDRETEKNFLKCREEQIYR